MNADLSVGERLSIKREHLDDLFDALRGRGYRIVGPTRRGDSIAYDEISSSADLPSGWIDEQGGGTYRLERRGDDALFGYSLSPQSWKRELFPPSSALVRAERDGSGFEAKENEESAPPTAFIGVRSCELAAIEIQDRVFVGGQHIDPVYERRRQGAFIVAVNCGRAGETCFCVSMKTGPRVTHGFDLALTELLDEKAHRFVVEVGTPAGADVMRDVTCAATSPADVDEANAIVERTASSMGRTMDTTGIKDLLYENMEHPRWDDVATRCLSCANCTMVCPTCFCFSVEDITDIQGSQAERRRTWDSCFTLEHSYIHGGAVRPSIRSHYRQWMTHKLATWIEQFGTSGCVGCGRCITWCPVGIDITEEVAAIRADPGRRSLEGAADGNA